MNSIILTLPFLPLFFARIQKNRLSSFVYVVYALVLIIFIGFRAASPAGDLLNYFYRFIEFHQSSNWLDLYWENLGVGFSFALISHFFDDYETLIFVYSLIPISLFATILWKQANRPFFALFLLLSLFYHQYAIEQYRQFVALAIVMWALFETDKIKQIIIIFLASLFHPTALIVLAICVLPSRLFSWKFYAICVVLVFAFDLLIGDFLLRIFGGWGYVSQRVDFYTDFAEKQDLEYGFITTALIIRLFFFFYLLIEKKGCCDKRFAYMMNIYFLSIVVYKVFSFIPEMATRGSVYFTLVEPILLTNYLFTHNKKKLIYFFCIAVLLLSLYRQTRAWDSYKTFKYELIDTL